MTSAIDDYDKIEEIRLKILKKVRKLSGLFHRHHSKNNFFKLTPRPSPH